MFLSYTCYYYHSKTFRTFLYLPVPTYKIKYRIFRKIDVIDNRTTLELSYYYNNTFMQPFVFALPIRKNYEMLLHISALQQTAQLMCYM